MNIQWKKKYIYIQLYMSYTNLGRQIFPLFLLCILVSFSTLSLSSPSTSLLLPFLLPRHFSVLSLTLVVKFIETMLQVWGKEVKQTVFTMPKHWNAKGKSSFPIQKVLKFRVPYKKVLELKQKKIFRNIKVLDQICFTGIRF